MKNQSLWVFAALLMLSTATAESQETNGQVEKAVLALEKQWIQSDTDNNPNLAAPLMADKYVNTWIDGTVLDKSQTLKGARARNYTSAVDEDLKVTVFGNTAIVTGVYKGKGTDAGKPFDEALRWTDTWVKMPTGKWQCVATQYTSISSPSR